MQIFGGWKVEREGEGGEYKFSFLFAYVKKKLYLCSRFGCIANKKTEREKS